MNSECCIYYIKKFIISKTLLTALPSIAAISKLLISPYDQID